MPTYTFKCLACLTPYEVVRSIREHCENPRPFVCCGQPAERWFELDGSTAAVNNRLAGDRHYDGLTATDGTDISTRSKHRAYMKANNLAMADDYKEAWAKAQEQRDAYRQGKAGGAVTRELIEAVARDYPGSTVTRNDIARAIEQYEASRR